VSPPFDSVESVVIGAVQWLRLFVELLGALIIGWGIAVSLLQTLKLVFSQQPREFTGLRIAFARYLALALEFQLAADILSTAIAPSWDAIGKLGAVAVIRTALNYFLMREMREEPSTARGEVRMGARETGASSP
jgi:uncharacterized membrane protein